MKVNEFNIPVPWGFIAAKAWGDENDPLILMIHGQSDNLGTFDRLIPYLPALFYYVCIDLPGHGKSSHYPPHIPVHTINNIVAYKIVVDYLNREKLIIIGHSWGGQMALLFTQLYPKYILKLIILDALHLYPLSIDYMKQFITERIKTFIAINQKMTTRKPPSYAYEEAITRLLQGRMYGELSREAADALLKRSLIPLENGKFRFSGDIRTKASISLLYGERMPEILIKQYPVTCPVLIIIASDSIPMLEYLKPFVQEIQRRNRNCIIRKVTGNHDVHNNNPEVVAPVIIDFLTRSNSKL